MSNYCGICNSFLLLNVQFLSLEARSKYKQYDGMRSETTVPFRFPSNEPFLSVNVVNR